MSQVGALERAANDIDVIFFLRDAEVDPVVHHLAEGLELPLRDVELDDLGGGDVRGPVEGLGLVAAYNENVLLVDHHDLPLGDLSIVDFEGGPAEGLEIVKGVLVELGEVEELLREAIGLT